jgi:hypothetical protein
MTSKQVIEEDVQEKIKSYLQMYKKPICADVDTGSSRLVRGRLPEDGIKLSPPSARSGDASSIIGGRVEVCLQQICLWWICSDLFVVRLHLHVFRLDPFDLHSSSAAVVVLVRWFYVTLAR